MNTLWQRLSKLKDRLSGTESQSIAGMPAVTPQPGMAKEIVKGILATRADEIGCEECFAQLDQFADLQLGDASAEEALPLVEDHLKRCKDCREEFEMLLMALEATA